METEARPLPLSQMARLLRLPVGWLRDECDAGRIPHLRAGRAYLFDPVTVGRVLLERAKKEGASDGNKSDSDCPTP